MNKKELLHLLLEYPNISIEEYNDCIKLKKYLTNENAEQIKIITEKIELYNKKETIINMIKQSPVIEPTSPCMISPLKNNFV